MNQLLYQLCIMYISNANEIENKLEYCVPTEVRTKCIDTIYYFDKLLRKFH